MNIVILGDSISEGIGSKKYNYAKCLNEEKKYNSATRSIVKSYSILKI